MSLVEGPKTRGKVPIKKGTSETILWSSCGKKKEVGHNRHTSLNR